MKKVIFASLMGLALVAFTGCTTGNDAEAAKCQSGKCDGAKKAPAKCNGAKKCDSAKKCDAGKCGK